MELQIQPKVIRVLNPDDKLYIEKNRIALNLPVDMQFLTPNEAKNKNLPIVAEGTTYSLNPIEEQYELYKGQEDNVAERRRFAIMEIVSLLGARRIRYSEHSFKDLQEEKLRTIGVGSEVDLVMSGGVPLGGDAKVNIKKVKQEHEKNSDSVIYTADWYGKSTIEAYKLAYTLVKKYGFSEDGHIKSLLSMRNPKLSNPIQKQTYEVSLNKEFKETHDLIVDCNGAFSKLSINGKYDHATKKETFTEKKLYFEVEFGEYPDENKELLHVQNDLDEHTNMAILSNITTDKVEYWDNAELNAKTYADDLNSATIVRVEGLEAQAHEHPNEDALSEISIGSIALWNTSPKIIAECDARLNIEKIRINNLEKKSHEHKNNEILEHINEDNIKSWNTAENNAKQYAESVSSRAEQNAKNHANQLNNQTTQSINSLKEQLQQQKHSNREVLDGISTERVKKWDNSEQNAINHSDEIKQKLTKRIDDLNWILTEKMNAQESLLQQTIERHIAFEAKLKKILITLGCIAAASLLLSILLICGI